MGGHEQGRGGGGGGGGVWVIGSVDNKGAKAFDEQYISF